MDQNTIKESVVDRDQNTMKEPAVDRNTMKEPAIDRNTMKKPAEYPLQESASEGTAEYVPPEVNVPRLLRKIDRRVLPMIFIVYVFAFLDRANISNALTMGLQKDLGLTGQQPNIALVIFFVPYIAFEIPSNLMMKRLTPRIWMSMCILGFGVAMLGQGFVKNYSGLLATRFFLGLCEAGMFPGGFYLISFWYPRDESQKRFTGYWCSVIFASMFGGLLATGIAKMDGVGGLSNWRWIFVLEGLATILVGVASFFLISEFPEEAKWITPAEREFVLARQQTSLNDKVTLKDIGIFFKDIKNYFAAVMYFSVVVPVYAFAYFTPTLVKALGYSVVRTQLHSVPPFAAALGLCVIMAYFSDRTKIRLPYILFGQALLITGLAILIAAPRRFPIQYAGICLVCMGAFGSGAVIVCWYLMNLQGHRQRSVGSAWMVSFGNTGGILAPFTFLAKYAPRYHTGYSICISVVALGAATTLCYAGLIVAERRGLGEKANQKRKYLSL